MHNNTGIIIHWGLYSVPAFDDIKSVRRRKMKNGSEWYLRRLTEKSDYRPISGYKETQEYHKKTFGDVDYFSLISQFDNESAKWNPLELCQYLKKGGVSYVILTAKHHDGFCLWNTKTQLVKKSKRNIVNDFVVAARLCGLRVGLYYSLFEFNINITANFINEIVMPQISELMNFNPDIWWFDGDWEYVTDISHKKLKEISILLRKKNANVEINDRLNGKNAFKEDEIGNGTYKNFGDRYMPIKKPDVNWEHIVTIGHSWGYNKEQEPKDYQDGIKLFEIHNKVKEMNGNFLINLGPKSDGTLDDNEKKSLDDYFEKI